MGTVIKVLAFGLCLIFMSSAPPPPNAPKVSHKMSYGGPVVTKHEPNKKTTPVRISISSKPVPGKVSIPVPIFK